VSTEEFHAVGGVRYLCHEDDHYCPQGGSVKKRKALIEFSGTLTVYEDGDEYEGGSLSESDAQGWLWHALARGDKHAGNYLTSGGVTSISYEDYDEDE